MAQGEAAAKGEAAGGDAGGDAELDRAATAAQAQEAALVELCEAIAAQTGDAVVDQSVSFGEATIDVDPNAVTAVVKTLRDHPALMFTTLVDLCVVDYPSREQRFDVVYHFLSMPQNQRIRVRAALREDQAIASISSLHPSANWFEREAFDMYGVIFTGHPDLRRILTDYGFRGYPLRKDFPTTGYVEVRYNEETKRVVYEPVQLVQEYRRFDFMSPWEGAEYILPGDDKAAR